MKRGFKMKRVHKGRRRIKVRVLEKYINMNEYEGKEKSSKTFCHICEVGTKELKEGQVGTCGPCDN